MACIECSHWLDSREADLMSCFAAVPNIICDDVPSDSKKHL